MPCPSLCTTAALSPPREMAGGTGPRRWGQIPVGHPELWTRGGTKARHRPARLAQSSAPTPRSDSLPGVSASLHLLGWRWVSAGSAGCWCHVAVAVAAAFIPGEQSPTSGCPVRTCPETSAEAIVVSWGAECHLCWQLWAPGPGGLPASHLRDPPQLGCLSQAPMFKVAVC